MFNIILLLCTIISIIIHFNGLKSSLKESKSQRYRSYLKSIKKAKKLNAVGKIGGHIFAVLLVGFFLFLNLIYIIMAMLLIHNVIFAIVSILIFIFKIIQAAGVLFMFNPKRFKKYIPSKAKYFIMNAVYFGYPIIVLCYLILMW